MMKQLNFNVKRHATKKRDQIVILYRARAAVRKQTKYATLCMIIWGTSHLLLFIDVVGNHNVNAGDADAFCFLFCFNVVK